MRKVVGAIARPSNRGQCHAAELCWPGAKSDGSRHSLHASAQYRECATIKHRLQQLIQRTCVFQRVKAFR